MPRSDQARPGLRPSDRERGNLWHAHLAPQLLNPPRLGSDHTQSEAHKEAPLTLTRRRTLSDPTPTPNQDPIPEGEADEEALLGMVYDEIQP